jgi:hypothetical protein
MKLRVPKDFNEFAMTVLKKKPKGTNAVTVLQLAPSNIQQRQ